MCLITVVIDGILRYKSKCIRGVYKSKRKDFRLTYLRKRVVFCILRIVKCNFKEISDACNNRKWSKSLLILSLVFSSTNALAQTQSEPIAEPKQDVVATAPNNNSVATNKPTQRRGSGTRVLSPTGSPSPSRRTYALRSSGRATWLFDGC